MENNPVLLKSSMFGGFKKKDVLSYIFELNETTQEEKQRLAEQLEELVQSRDNLAANVTEMEQKIATLQASLDDALARLQEEATNHSQSKGLIETLKAEVSRHEETVSQQNAEIARQTELNSQMAEKNRSHEEKRHQVELAASQIAELLGQAHDDAEKTIKRAQLEAEKIVENAKASLGLHVEEANKSVDSAYEKFIKFKAEIEGLHLSVHDATNSIKEKMSSFKDSIDDLDQKVPKKLNVDDLPSLQYEQEPEPDAETPEAQDENPVSVTAAAITPSAEVEAENITNDVLRRYGVRKDDSGFFRLASDQ